MIIGLTVIKNEEQIIELFCRHNLNLLDKIYIVDNCSFDYTLDIVKKLIEEGLNIELIQGFSSIKHDQEVAMTATLKLIKEKDDPDWVFLLDADEFINVRRDKKTFHAEFSKMDKNKLYDIRWLTYVPHKIVLSETDNFVKMISTRRENDNVLQNKVIVSRNLINELLEVSPGNHNLRYVETKVNLEKTILISAVLAHIPIRTIFNTIVRLILNSHTLSMKSHKERGETEHWMLFAEYIRNKKYNLNAENLETIALSYGAVQNIGKNVIIEDPIKSYDNVEVKYKERTNPLVYFDKYIGNLIKNME